MRLSALGVNELSSAGDAELSGEQHGGHMPYSYTHAITMNEKAFKGCAYDVTL